MSCSHIDKYDAGATVCDIQTTSNSGRLTITTKEFKRSMILEKDIGDWFYHYVENDRYWTQNQTQVLKKLNQIDFHDLAVNRMSIDYDYLTFSLDFEIYNEQVKDFDLFKLEFKNLLDFKLDRLFIDSESDIEITSFEYKQTDIFEGILIFLLGHGKPSLTVEFKCESIKLT